MLKLKIVIIGLGLIGFYIVVVLLKVKVDVEIDVIDSLLIFYGLVCGGVVLDYQSIKNVMWVYEKLVILDGVVFVGNVIVGCDVLLDEFCEFYDVVVLCVGFLLDNLLDIFGVDKRGVMGVVVFVGWYNVYFDFVYLFDKLILFFVEVEIVVVIGVGNVVIDVVCVLLCMEEEFGVIDIVGYVVEVIVNSLIKDIYMIVCWDVVYVKFILQELCEMGEF